MDQSYSVESIPRRNGFTDSTTRMNSKSKTLSDGPFGLFIESDPQRDSIATNQSAEIGQSRYPMKTKGRRVPLGSFEEINKRTIHGSKKCFTFISGLFNRWKNLGRFNDQTQHGVSKQLCSCPQLRNDSLGQQTSCQELRTMSAGYIVVVTEGDDSSVVNDGAQYLADDRDSGKASGSEAIFTNNYVRPPSSRRAPVAKMDSFETTSFASDCSLDSNDLMLDVFDESYSTPVRFGYPSPKLSLKALRSSERSLNKKVRKSSASSRKDCSSDLVMENLFTQRLFQSEPRLDASTRPRGYSSLDKGDTLSSSGNDPQLNTTQVGDKTVRKTLSLLNGVDALSKMIYPL